MQTESEYRPLGPITKKAMIVNDVSKFKKELKYISGKDIIGRSYWQVTYHVKVLKKQQKM